MTVRASLKGTGRSEKSGLVFGIVQPWRVTLIELGRHDLKKSVFKNSLVHWIPCEICSLNGVVRKENSEAGSPLDINI